MNHLKQDKLYSIISLLRSNYIYNKVSANQLHWYSAMTSERCNDVKAKNQNTE